MINLTPYMLSIAAFIIALSFHEFCHALCAYLLGDPTAQRMGRLTLNPFAHLDPLGLICLILFRFGWARPVPFNPQYFTHPRLYSVLVGLAGPFSNFFLAVLSLVTYKFLASIPSFHTPPLVGEFLEISAWINVMLGVFNLIPIPPLDGSHLVRALIPDSLVPLYQQFERISFFLLIFLIWLTPVREALVKIIDTVSLFLILLIR